MYLAACQQVISQVHGRGLAILRDAFTLQNLVDSLEDNKEINHEGKVLDIAKIIIQLVLPCHGIAAADLRQTSKALSNRMAFPLFRRHEHHVPHQQRPRADDGHVAFQDVEKLRKLIERRGTEEAAVRNETLLVGQRIAIGIRFTGHCTEFDETEDLLVLPWPQLSKERIPFHLDRADNRQKQKNGREDDDGAEREEKIQNTFEVFGIHLIQLTINNLQVTIV